MRDAVLVYSTGRCGTQWLAKVIEENYADQFSVAHEPLRDRLEPREALGIESLESAPDLAALIVGHVAEIEKCLESRRYVECGHVGWSVLPHFAALLGDRLRVVHLIRHPVPMAWSWLTHGVYQPQLAPHLPDRELLSPFDAGVGFPSYRERWSGMSPYEKCLYYWLEVNALGMRLQERLKIPWLRLRAEDLFDGAGWGNLREFLELPEKEAPEAERGRVVDRFRYLCALWPDWRQIEAHPEVTSLMEELGYGLGDVNEEVLSQRYLGAPAGSPDGSLA